MEVVGRIQRKFLSVERSEWMAEGNRGEKQ